MALALAICIALSLSLALLGKGPYSWSRVATLGRRGQLAPQLGVFVREALQLRGGVNSVFFNAITFIIAACKDTSKQEKSLSLGPRTVISLSLSLPDQAWPAAAYLRALQRHPGSRRRAVSPPRSSSLVPERPTVADPDRTPQYAVAAPPNKHRYCTRS